MKNETGNGIKSKFGYSYRQYWLQHHGAVKDKIRKDQTTQTPTKTEHKSGALKW